MPYRIPFNSPSFAGGEENYISEAIANRHLSGDGPFTKRCQALLANAVGTKSVLLTSSCTDALEMAALLLQIEPGDEVIVPSFTFVSTANAFALRGAKIVFCDVRPDTFNLDEAKLEALISERTRAVVPVHYAGVGCEMDGLISIAERNNLAIVEDNAHGLFGKYRGGFLGTLGGLATQSFHETKNFSCGEGGALLLNDTTLVERAEILREKGTDRSRFFRGQTDKYTWVDVGSSFLPSDLLAAVLYAQLEARETIQTRRAGIWNGYQSELKAWASENAIRQPIVPAHCAQTYHLYSLLLPSLEERQRFIQHMKEREVQCVFHYLPLHSSPKGLEFGGQLGDCPVTEAVSDRLVRLPLYNSMSEAERKLVVEAALAFRIPAAERRRDPLYLAEELFHANVQHDSAVVHRADRPLHRRGAVAH